MHRTPRYFPSTKLALTAIMTLVLPVLSLGLAACSAGGGGGKDASSSSASGAGGVDFTSANSSGPGSGAGGSVGLGTGSGGGVNCEGLLPVTIRDFTAQTSPDFEQGNNVDDKGIVTADLGPDFKPVYAGNPNTVTT